MGSSKIRSSQNSSIRTMSVGHQEENNTFLAVDVADEVGKRVCRGMRRIYFIALFAISAPIKLHCLIVT